MATFFRITQGDAETHLIAGTTIGNGRVVDSLSVGESVTLNPLLGALPITAIETYTVEE